MQTPRLILASTNPGKIEEVRKCFFAYPNIKILSLRDFPDIGEIEETGVTYEENARLKVRMVFEKTGIPALGDDGGFEVEHLGGEPGIRSHRWLGSAATDYDRALGILKLLEGLPAEARKARLGSVMAFYDGKDFAISEHWVLGTIPESIDPGKIQEGFPYRCLLFIEEMQKLYSDLDAEESYSINHRIKNVHALEAKILASLGHKSVR